MFYKECCRPGQVVMTEEVLESTAMVRQLWREGQRVTHEAGDALPHRVVHTLTVLGVPGVLREGLVVCRRHDPGGDRISLTGCSAVC